MTDRPHGNRLQRGHTLRNMFGRGAPQDESAEENRPRLMGKILKGSPHREKTAHASDRSFSHFIPRGNRAKAHESDQAGTSEGITIQSHPRVNGRPHWLEPESPVRANPGNAASYGSSASFPSASSYESPPSFKSTSFGSVTSLDDITSSSAPPVPLLDIQPPSLPLGEVVGAWHTSQDEYLLTPAPQRRDVAWHMYSSMRLASAPESSQLPGLFSQDELRTASRIDVHIQDGYLGSRYASSNGSEPPVAGSRRSSSLAWPTSSDFEKAMPFGRSSWYSCERMCWFDVKRIADTDCPQKLPNRRLGSISSGSQASDTDNVFSVASRDSFSNDLESRLGARLSPSKESSILETPPKSPNSGALLWHVDLPRKIGRSRSSFLCQGRVVYGSTKGNFDTSTHAANVVVRMQPGYITPSVASGFNAAVVKHIPGRSPEDRILAAWVLVRTILNNFLIEGEQRGIAITGSHFRQRIPWVPETCKLFLDVFKAQFHDVDGAHILRIPDFSTHHARLRLITLWYEVNLLVHRWESALTPHAVRDLHKMRGLHLVFRGANIISHEIVQTFSAAEVDLLGDSFSTKGIDTAMSAVFPRASSFAFACLGLSPADTDQTVLAAAAQQLDTVSMTYPSEAARGAFWVWAYVNRIARVRPSAVLDAFLEETPSIFHFDFTLDDVDKAYSLLGLAGVSETFQDCVSDENVIIDRLYACLDHGNGDQIVRAAQVLAWYRNSTQLQVTAFSLSEYAQSQASQVAIAPATPRALTYENAIELLGLESAQIEEQGPEADEMMTTVYSIRVADDPDLRSTLTRALALINDHRKSKFISSFLRKEAGWEDETGSSSDTNFSSVGSVSTVPSSLDLPTGLNNIANTCYLNSLLQYLYSILPLRSAVLECDPLPLAQIAVPENATVGSRGLSRDELLRSQRFLLHLKQLFADLERRSASSISPHLELVYMALVPAAQQSNAVLGDVVTTQHKNNLADGTEGGPSGDATLKDSDAEQKEDATLSVEESTESQEMPIDASPPEASPRETPKNGDTPLAVDEGSHKHQDNSSDKAYARLVELTNEVSSYMAFGNQNDVTECMDNIMFQLEAAFSYTCRNAKNVIKSLFHGVMLQSLFVPDESKPRTQNEPFSFLLVNVNQDGLLLHDGLDRVFDQSRVTIDGKVASRSMSLADVPNVLQIQLQRVQYDVATQTVFKSNARIDFPKTLSVERYLTAPDADSPSAAKYASSNALRHDISVASIQLVPETKLAVLSQAMELASQHKEDSSNETPAAISPEEWSLFQDLCTKELESVRQANSTLTASIGEKRASLNALWPDTEGDFVYDLEALFFHRGTATSGHYYLVRYDRAADRWLLYNDANVHVVPESEIYRSDATNNPYLLTYTRRSKESS